MESYGYGTFQENSEQDGQKRISVRLPVLGLVLFIGLCSFSYEKTPVFRPSFQQIAVSFTPEGKVMAEYGNESKADAIATARFNDSLHDIGWSQLWVDAIPTDPFQYESVRQAAYAAGYAEGALTHHRIDQHLYNTYMTFFGKEKNQKAPSKLLEFFAQNLQWLRDQVAAHTKKATLTTDLLDSEYWHTVGTVLARFDGLVDGYQAYSERSSPYSSLELYLLNADGDLEDLIPALNKTRTRQPGAMAVSLAYKSLKCSALIRILPNASDVVFGHTTWDQYSAMNRIFKHYNLPVASRVAPRQIKMSLSSSPGYLSSVDDYYLLDSGLSVMETTNGVYRNELYNLIVPQSALSWVRSMVANTLARTGHHWAQIFSKFNSGTYNNQWMILNLNRFQPGYGFQAGGLTIVEQMPGRVQTADLTHILDGKGYWASYNVPFFDSIYRDTGFADMYRKNNYTSRWSHEYCPRARIFRRDAPQVEALSDLKRLLRYNDWKNDPLSEGHASNTVSARYDLESGAKFSLDGGIDTKVSSYSMAKTLETEAISGPTCDQNPVYTWLNESLPYLPHRGHPNVFNFTYHLMQF